MSCGQVKTALPKAALRPPVAVLLLEAAFSLKPYGFGERGPQTSWGHLELLLPPTPNGISQHLLSWTTTHPLSAHEDSSKPRCPDLEGDHAQHL